MFNKIISYFRGDSEPQQKKQSQTMTMHEVIQQCMLIDLHFAKNDLSEEKRTELIATRAKLEELKVFIAIKELFREGK